MEDEAHRLGIDRWQVRVRAAPGTAPDWARRMDLAMRGPAARALGDAMETLFAGRTAVVRIDRLKVDWSVTEALASGGDLAHELGRRVADRIAAAVSGTTASSIRIWPDHAAHAAAYALARLGLRPEPHWAFPDYAALTVLTGPEAATEILASGGAAVLARLAEAGLPPDHLLAKLGEAGAAQVVLALAKPARITQPGLIAAVGALRLTDAHPTSFGSIALRLLLSELAAPAERARVTADAGRSLAETARAALSLLALATRRAAGESAADIMAQPQRRTAANGPLTFLQSEVIAELAADPELWGRALLLTASAARGEVWARDRPEAKGETVLATRDLQPSARTEGVVVHSPFMGLAPLVSLCPCPTATPETLRAVALHLLFDDDHARAELDAGFAALFPADPRKPPGALPEPSPALWTDQGTLAGAIPRAGLATWADLWLARFAARLQGLQASSRGYLQREFLCRPGRFETTAPNVPIHIILPPFPLGIVLRMSGLTGLTPPVPHLRSRRLLIDLER